MKTHAYDRHPAVPPAEQRPHPQVLETMLDELEDKVRHYFLLYMKEKQKRQKAEKFSYWLQREVADSRQQLEDSRSAAAALEAKLLEIRGDPDAVRDTVQRVDLMYAQIDTLVQAFAGVCSFVATQEADKATVLQCVLEYLYPCRALDPRLGSLYGALYYYRLGERKGLPQQPPPPPEPKFMPVYEVMGPWIQPSPFTATPAPPLHATKFDAALAATLEAAKAQEVAQEDPQRQPKKAAASPLSRAKEAQTIATTTSSGTAAAGAAGSRAKASLPQQAADASADVDLKGFSVLLEELSGFKRPSLSKGTGVKLVVRFDHESSVEAKRKAERCIVIEKCDGKAGDESASIYFLAELSPLPPKKAGVVPKICIDIYDNKSPTGLGSANKLFTDPDTVKKGAAWQIKDARGTILGSITVSIAPLPL
ncbi:Chromosome III, complete sequence, related [Eimeria maxima]|uniref:Chromosome III, complete sequence, related n=1 Tax=Eimeria maxima TaxID=5804 RepID=U6MBR0_EIMMA|nr:Chromosome III, complete sequence, related [Eimeria maxima]CDJ61481.1 Chromosome III, complete sequence, related [Eimeria maxima]